MEEREKAVRLRLKSDFVHYAAKCLRIRTKSGQVEPLALNRAQLHLHERLEEQRARIGKVRAVVLKGRQAGFSTYIEARFYWRVSHRRGTQAYILTHEQDATDNLFGMAKRYHDNCPELVKPQTGRANAKELNFDALDSGYSVGTAGTIATGRSKTIQFFHGSEVAFWPNAPSHFAAVVQTVPDLPDTEIILESTGNGLGNEFHQRWQQAEAGIGDYIAVFVPWFWTAEYRRDPEGAILTEAEEAYREAHGLDAAQMAWRRAKIAELGGDELIFMQEYPATAAEAFQTVGHDSFIKSDRVLAARKRSVEGIGALVIGVDPKREGTDRFAFARRRGRQVFGVTGDPSPIDTIDAAHKVRAVIDDEKPDRVFIDAGGNGAAVFDILKSWGEPYKSVIRLVNFGSAPTEPERLLPDGTKRPGPKNRRAEMWLRSKEWLDDPAGVELPDRDDIQADACAPAYHYDMQQRLLLESKDHMRQRNIRSPDLWDAVALTFAEPVAFSPVPPPPRRPKTRSRTGWMRG